MTEQMHNPVLWGLAAVAVLAALVLYRTWRANARLRQEKEQIREHYADVERGYSEAAEEARLLANEATKTALKTAMRTLQGLANEQQLVISQLQDKYGDSKILQDLLEIDHANSQFGRRAQSIAVLCDGWLGRTRDVASLYDVVRSAKGRIRHFKRVEIRSQSNYAVVSRAVEPLALAVAELLDNATSYSAPETLIEINIRPVPKGVCVVIDDAGVGMSEEEKGRAAELLSPQRPTGVTDLGNPPQFGFAVVGVLAHRYGFQVSVDSASPYGGVRAVVLLPEDLLTTMPEPEPTPAPSAVRPDTTGQTTAGGLPKRRRRGPVSVVSDTPERPGRQEGETSGADTAAIMGAFQRGTQSGRAAGANGKGHESQ
ncbi:ATP-binding protein [Streptomyces sp. TR06-5]|uniref:ATP-binding protein n=1 Tax=unclassified Streptomyces TaxID=2593676 RepID=UPI00399F451B